MQEAMTAKAEASQPLTTRPIDPLAENSVVTVTPPMAEVVVVVVVGVADTGTPRGRRRIEGRRSRERLSEGF